jgi:hypothetical protein
MLFPRYPEGMQENYFDESPEADAARHEARKQWLITIGMGMMMGMIVGAAIMYQIMQ